MAIFLKRTYAVDLPGSGCRILVDRLWPRGISRDKLKLDDWLKDVAPSDALRKAFHGGDIGWGEFRKRYLAELKQHRDTLRDLARTAKSKRITLIYSSEDEEHNNAVVLKQYLQILSVDK